MDILYKMEYVYSKEDFSLEWLLFENRPALYFCNYKENKIIMHYVEYLPHW